MDEPNFWKKCSTCKKEIPFSTRYYVCSVSTCRHKRKGFRFCSVPCWDAHVGMMNHRDAWAQEEVSPTRAVYLQSMANEEISRAPVRKIVDGPTQKSEPTYSSFHSPKDLKTDTLVVVSKVKQLIKDTSGYNTSQCCIDALTRKVVHECLQAIAQAEKAGRKTVMGRDVR